MNPITALFTPKGRINRIWFAVYKVPLLYFLLTLSGSIQKLQPLSETDPELFVTATIIFLAVAILLLGLNFCLSAKRWHDVNQPAWWHVLEFVPYLNLLVLGFLFLMPPSKDENDYDIDQY